MGILSPAQLESVGLRHCGRDVRISDKASIYNPGNIEISDFTRIDDFCVLSAGDGGISIGRNVHIAVFSSLIGAGRIEVRDFANISSRVSIYASNSDYSGEWMTNPTVPEEFAPVTNGPVTLERHALIGSGSVVLPNVVLFEGAVVGALSLVKSSCEAFGIYAGVPAKKIGRRGTRLLDLEAAFLAYSADSAS
jgi:galactoside O-acetyltransferase